MADGFGLNYKDFNEVFSQNLRNLMYKRDISSSPYFTKTAVSSRKPLFLRAESTSNHVEKYPVFSKITAVLTKRLTQRLT